MHNTKWYSFKHNAWATVTDEPKTKNGYYTVCLERQDKYNDGHVVTMYRRYDAERIQTEIAEHKDIDTQISAQTKQVATGTINTFNNTNVVSNSNAISVPREGVARKEGKLIGLIFEK